MTEHPPTDARTITCVHCGARLGEFHADGRNITVEDRTFPFSRTTDFVRCPGCGVTEHVRALHVEGRPVSEAIELLHDLASRDDGPDDAA